MNNNDIFHRISRSFLFNETTCSIVNGFFEFEKDIDNFNFNLKIVFKTLRLTGLGETKVKPRDSEWNGITLKLIYVFKHKF